MKTVNMFIFTMKSGRVHRYVGDCQPGELKNAGQGRVIWLVLPGDNEDLYLNETEIESMAVQKMQVNED